MLAGSDSVRWISLGFALLVGQKKGLEHITLVFLLFSDFSQNKWLTKKMISR